MVSNQRLMVSNLQNQSMTDRQDDYYNLVLYGIALQNITILYNQNTPVLLNIVHFSKFINFLFVSRDCEG